MEALREALVSALGDERRVTAGESELDLHGADLTYHAPRRPDLVVYAETAAEVAAVLRLANERRVPVVPFGAGTSLEGHVIPVRGGISLDLTRMNRVRSIQPADLVAVAEAGVTRGALNAAAADHGLFFPVDPGADATLGGMAATNASGTTTVRYGGMRTHVLGLEVALADGSVVRTGGRTAKTSAGYNLTGLFVGSEGTLGVITELTLRLRGIPDYAVAARAIFGDLESACRAAAALVAVGSQASRVELLDAPTIAAVNSFSGTSLPELPSLFVELAGTRSAVEEELVDAEALLRAEGATAVDVERDPTACARLWSARHNAAYARAAVAPPGTRMKSTDVCVPVSELAAGIEATREVVEREGIDAVVIAHAGDGNFHVGFAVDPEDAQDVARAERVNDAIVDWALDHGGTCSGEHGIGLGKIGYLEREHADLIPLMQGIKKLLDPNGILNPGKVLPEER